VGKHARRANWHARAGEALAGKRAALIALAIGMTLAGAGAAGLVLARHPVPARLAAVIAIPAPTGPISSAQQSQAAAIARPVSLIIPSLGVQTSLVRLGLTTSGALAVPPSTAVAGWYTGSPRPGAIGPAVIAGHVDSRHGPGVFFHLDQLQRGDRVYIRRADGTLVVFRVTTVRVYAKDGFPTLAVYGPVPDPELRLVTCGGNFDPDTRSYLSNTIVYAVETS
jgi:LPXTG-site transpeptidase (sortase) family protein